MSMSDLFARTGPHWKDPKGTTRAVRVRKRIAFEQHEARMKTIVRKRDGYRCRWPGCDCRERRDRIEVAHVVNKSAGGSSEASNLICLCVARHRGRPSLHSGDLRIEPLTAAGTNGPCAFLRRYLGREGWYFTEETHRK